MEALLKKNNYASGDLLSHLVKVIWHLLITEESSLLY